MTTKPHNDILNWLKDKFFSHLYYKYQPLADSMLVRDIVGYLKLNMS